MLKNINLAARSLAARECEQSTEWRDIADAACLCASTPDEKTQMLMEKYSKMFFRLQKKCIETDFLRDMLTEFEAENAEQAAEIERLKAQQAAELERLKSALIDIGNVLLKNRVFRFDVKDILDINSQRVCLIINRALGVEEAL